MSVRLKRLVALAAVDPEERKVAGSISGVLYLMGAAVTLTSFIILPGATDAHPIPLLAIAAVDCAWGACSLLLIDWNKAPSWLIHVAGAAGFVVIAVAMASTGGASSPVWI